MNEEKGVVVLKNKILGVFGFLLHKTGILIVLFTSYIILKEIFIEKYGDVLNVIHLYTYAVLAIFLVICGVAFRNISKNYISFFNDESEEYIGRTQFRHFTIWIIFIIFTLATIFYFFEEKARGQLTELLLELVFIILMIYVLVVSHYKKIIESQKEEAKE